MTVLSNSNIPNAKKLNKKVAIQIIVKVPKGMTDEEESEFLSSLTVAMRSKVHFSYMFGEKNKSISIWDAMEVGYEYVKG